MYYRFKKKSEENGVYIYDYAYESWGVMTGVVKYNKNTDEIDIIKLADNDGFFRKEPPVRSVVLKRGGPERAVIAYG